MISPLLVPNIPCKIITHFGV